ncbi:MFS transporter [Streptomyces cucumeris]|uniref:MFS transporter n=1 Tax=Streptomyces cucumeris TaxID=2962890 RepID=UPI003D7188A9
MSSERAGYPALLRSPGVPAVVLPSILARLPVGMTSVLLVLLVQNSTGSYRAAGLAMGANWLAFAATSPFYGRVSDRGHAVWVMVIVGCANPLATIGFLLLVHNGAPVWAIVAGAAVAGGAAPPIAAVTRAVWPHLVDGRLHPVAFGFEAVVVEILYVLGPLVAGLVCAVASPSAGLLVGAAAVTIGSLSLARAPVIRSYSSRDTPRPARSGHVLASPAMRRILMVTFLMSVAYGVLEVLVPAFAVEAGSPSSSGLLLGVWSSASIVGGILYIRLTPRSPLVRQLVVLIFANAAGFAVLAVAREPWQLALLLAVGGTLMAPATSVEYMLASRNTDSSRATEGFTWFGTVAYGGAAAGGALAGVLIEPWGLPMTFLAAAFGAVLAGCFALRIADPGPPQETERTAVAERPAEAAAPAEDGSR